MPAYGSFKYPGGRLRHGPPRVRAPDRPLVAAEPERPEHSGPRSTPLRTWSPRSAARPPPRTAGRPPKTRPRRLAPVLGDAPEEGREGDRAGLEARFDGPPSTSTARGSKPRPADAERRRRVVLAWIRRGTPELAGARSPGPGALDHGAFGAGAPAAATRSPGGPRPEAPKLRDRRRAPKTERREPTATKAPTPRPERSLGDRRTRRRGPRGGRIGRTRTRTRVKDAENEAGRRQATAGQGRAARGTAVQDPALERGHAGRGHARAHSSRCSARAGRSYCAGWVTGS